MISISSEAKPNEPNSEDKLSLSFLSTCISQEQFKYLYLVISLSK